MNPTASIPHMFQKEFVPNDQRANPFTRAYIDNLNKGVKSWPTISIQRPARDSQAAGRASLMPAPTLQHVTMESQKPLPARLSRLHSKHPSTNSIQHRQTAAATVETSQIVVPQRHSPKDDLPHLQIPSNATNPDKRIYDLPTPMTPEQLSPAKTTEAEMTQEINHVETIVAEERAPTNKKCLLLSALIAALSVAVFALSMRI